MELYGGDKPALVPRRADHAIPVKLAQVTGVVAALEDGAADPSASLGFAALTTGRTGLTEVLSKV